MIVVLDNIRSKHNVGSIFRTADAVGITKVYLGGITPAPIDKYGRVVSALTKVSLGAEKNIAWEKCQDTITAIKKLRSGGYKLVALEQEKDSIPYFDFNTHEIDLDKIALFLGSEVGGIDKNILKACDIIVEIPMQGKKESLNVSVAFGVVAFSFKYSKI